MHPNKYKYKCMKKLLVISAVLLYLVGVLIFVLFKEA
jgi:hypothetical protein